MAEFREGQTATNPKTGQKVVYKGGQWVNYSAPGAPAPARKLSPRDEKELIKQQEGAATALEVRNRVERVAPSAKRLDGGPWRGMFLDMALPNPQGGIMDRIGATILGAPAKLIGAITPQDVEDHQAITRAAVESTRQSETGEKGVQTEGDSARQLAATLTPYTSDSERLVREIFQKADRQVARPDFYTVWANKYGSLSALNEQGKSVEAAFREQYEAPSSPGTKRLKYNPATGKVE